MEYRECSTARELGCGWPVLSTLSFALGSVPLGSLWGPMVSCGGVDFVEHKRGMLMRYSNRKRRVIKEHERYARIIRHRINRERRKKARCCVVRFIITQEDEPFVREVRDQYDVGDLRGVRKLIPRSLVITLPEIFDFDKNYDSSARVISIFRRALMQRKRISYIDFSKMQEISPACIMVLTCYIDLWHDRAPRMSAHVQSWNPGIREAFEEIGFFRAMGFDKSANKSLPSYGPCRYMGIRGCLVNTVSRANYSQEIIQLRKDIESFAECRLNRQAMFKSVSEAILNIYDHAYDENIKPGRWKKGERKKWWVSVSYNEQSKELGIAIYDHGLGIPETIKHSTTFSWYKRVYDTLNKTWGEADRLWVAFERLRSERLRKRYLSRTQGRGKGCGDIVSFVSSPINCEEIEKPGSSISVISLKARYRYINTGEKTRYRDRGDKESLPVSLQGTLIEWRIKL